jgi:type IV pilus assembly protein PilC
LEEALDRLSRFYNEQVVYSLDRFSSLVEPLLLAVMGVFVSGLLLALFTPLYSFMDSL